jgi:hypothetical protein
VVGERSANARAVSPRLNGPQAVNRRSGSRNAIDAFAVAIGALVWLVNSEMI